MTQANSPLKYKDSYLLYQTVIRTSNKDSVFLYYALESWENLCFYSTLPFQQGQGYRDVKVRCTIEMKEELKKALEYLQREIPLEQLSEKQSIDKS